MSGEANIWNPRTLIEVSADTKAVEERLTASAGQTLFTLQTFAYSLDTGALEVHKNGLLLTKGVDWVEGTTTTFSLVTAQLAGDQIVATGHIGITADVDVRDTDIFVTNYQAIRDYAGIEITLYAQGRLITGDEGESFFQKKTGAAPGFYVDNGVTVLVPTGGDGSIGWIRTKDSYDEPTLASAIANQLLLPGGTVNITARVAGWEATLNGPVGAATYDVVTQAQHDIVRGTGVVDEIGDHTCANSRILLLKDTGIYYMDQFGADPIGGTDSSAAFDAIVARLPNGGVIWFGQGIYKGNYISSQPNLKLQGAGIKVTNLLTNSVATGDYVIDIDHGAQTTAKLPMSCIIRDMTVTGATGVHGIKLTQLKAGGINDIRIREVDKALELDTVFGCNFEDVFVQNDYNIGIAGITGANVSNNNTFKNWLFWQGNAARTANPINLSGLNNNHFEEMVMEGSGFMGTTTLVGGNGNTFLNCRWESCTQTGSTDPYVDLGGSNNKLITPVVTQLAVEALASPTYLVEVSGDNCVIEDLPVDIGTRVVKLTTTTNNCVVNLTTTAIPNINIENMVMDYAGKLAYNEISYNNGYSSMANGEWTKTKGEVFNYFTESHDMSGMTLDGLVQATMAGADSRNGPFVEGLIERFHTPTGNAAAIEDIFASIGSILARNVYCVSFWARSETVGGEDITVFAGRTISEDTRTIFIPDDRYVRVVEYFRSDNSAYAAYLAGWILPLASSGLRIYGPLFSNLGAQTGGSLIYPPTHAPGYVPTEAIAQKKVSPEYGLDRAHAVVPANGSGTVGDRLTKIRPVVGQPTGWRCTVTGTPGTWVAEANL